MKKGMILIVRIILAILILFGVASMFVYLQMQKTGFFGNFTEKECSADSDCVPDSCCHADLCVNKEKATNCTGVFCSQNCESSLDCGQGRCECLKNKCVVGK